MVSQGIPLPLPIARQDDAIASASVRPTGPLILAAPTSNTAYQIHPGVPPNRQRIEVSGYTTDGTSWAALRLMVDGQVIAEARNASRLSAWWQFVPGNHLFWLEGKRSADSEIERTESALVIIESAPATTVTSSNSP
jgi:hypothetical protein